MYLCMHVCMYTHNRFTTKIYGFTHSLHTSLACTAHDAITMEDDARTSPDVWKMVGCSTKG